jgi:hypothetical protein
MQGSPEPGNDDRRIGHRAQVIAITGAGAIQAPINVNNKLMESLDHGNF